MEVIAVDDGTRDDTGDALRSLTDPRFTLVRHDQNLGVAAARNTGARQAVGTHLLFIDSDDELPDGAVDAWLSALHSGCRLAFGRAFAPRPDGSAEWREPHDLGPAFNGVHGLFLAGTFVVRRDLFDRAGGYDEALRFSENSELGMRLSDLLGDRSNDVGLAEHTVLVISPRPDRAVEYADAQFHALSRILVRHAARLEQDAHLESDYRAVAGVAALRTNRRVEGRRQLWSSFLGRPTLRTGARCIAAWFPARFRPWRPGKV